MSRDIRLRDLPISCVLVLILIFALSFHYEHEDETNPIQFP